MMIWVAIHMSTRYIPYTKHGSIEQTPLEFMGRKGTEQGPIGKHLFLATTKYMDPEQGLLSGLDTMYIQAYTYTYTNACTCRGEYTYTSYTYTCAIYTCVYFT